MLFSPAAPPDDTRNLTGGTMPQETSKSSASIVTQSPSSDFPEGYTLGDRYRILRVLGRGGIGVVYQAEHLSTGKWVAIKVLHTHIRNELSIIRLFRKELHKLSRLLHPHAISVFDCGVLRSGDLFVVMEYLPGVDLGRLLKTGIAISWKLAIKIGLQACNALHQAHQMGLFHRNIKPANVMLTHYQGENDFVKLLDFGLTTAIESACRVAYLDEHYTAPEILQGQPATERSDVYGLASVLYELLTRRPFWRDQRHKTIFQHEHEHDQQVQRPVPPLLRRTLLNALSHHPQARYASISAFADALIEAQKEALEQAKNAKTTQELKRIRIPRPSDTDAAPEKEETPAQRLSTLPTESLPAPTTAQQAPLAHTQAPSASQAGQEHTPSDTPKESVTAFLDLEAAVFTWPSSIPVPEHPERSLNRQEWDHIANSMRWQVRAQWLVLLLSLSFLGYWAWQTFPVLHSPFRTKGASQSVDLTHDAHGSKGRATLAKLGQMVEGRHHFAGDVDYFQFELPPFAQVYQSWKAHPPERKRSATIAAMWKQTPLYRLLFYPVEGVHAQVELLDAQGRPLKTLHRQHEKESKDHTESHLPSHLSSEKAAYSEWIFSAEGRIFLRISSPHQADPSHTYSWIVEPLPRR